MRTNQPGDFLMPNSVIQTLTAVEKEGVDDISGLGVVVLLGMFAKVDPSHPGDFVYLNFSEILGAIGEIKACVQKVSVGCREYKNSRFSPKIFSAIKKDIDSIFNIRYCKTDKKNGRRKESWLPVFVEYGYEYSGATGPYDFNNLPDDLIKFNVCEDCSKPVYKLRRKKSGSFLPPERFFFRLESNLVAELQAKKNTKFFTVLSRKIFALLKRLGRTKILVRLVLLILRQRGDVFSRQLEKLLRHLGFDVSHRSRCIDHLEKMLGKLKQEKLVQGFQITDQNLQVQWNQQIFKELN